MDKLNQTIVGRRVGVSQSMISRYINGLARPTPEVAKKLEETTFIHEFLWLRGATNRIRVLWHQPYAFRRALLK